MKKKLIEYGIYPKKIIHFPHFVDSDYNIPNYQSGDYVLYFGRLSPEKGIYNLMETMSFFPKVKLKIAGTGMQN